jgi:ribose transport system permease protein
VRPLDLRAVLSRYGVVIVLLAIIVLFSVLRPESFPTASNAENIILTSAVLAILTLGMTLPLIAGEFDLSLAALLGFSGVTTAYFYGEQGLPPVLVLLIVLVVGGVVGLINSLLVILSKISSLIATIGTSSVISGVTLWLSDGRVLFDGMDRGLTKYGRNELLGIPLPIVYLVGVAIVLWYWLEMTQTGRELYACGEGREASRLSGLPINRLLIISFVGAGMLAAFAGMIEASRIGAGHPNSGPSFLLPAFAAAFLGATTIRPGHFNVVGTLVAVVLIAVGTNGLQQLGFATWVQPVFSGVVLITAVGLARLASKR